MSFRIWLLEESIGWTVPPAVLLEQPDWLMQDLATISWRKRQLEERSQNVLPGVPVRRGIQ